MYPHADEKVHTFKCAIKQCSSTGTLMCQNLEVRRFHLHISIPIPNDNLKCHYYFSARFLSHEAKRNKNRNKKICNELNYDAIPFHECMFIPSELNIYNIFSREKK